jgi:hypothetical protein
VIFADYTSTSAKLLAVFDYHPAGGVRYDGSSTRFPEADPLAAEELAKVGKPGNVGAAVAWPRQIPEGESALFGEHRALYKFPISEEWTRWKKANEVWMDQATFAAFIQDNLLTVADPTNPKDRARAVQATLEIKKFATASRLLRLSRDLKINVDMKIKQTINLASGEVQLVYEETHTDGSADTAAPVDVPGGFLLHLPVFVDSAPFEIVALLRYKKSGPGVSFQYSLYRLDQVFELAIKDEAQRVKMETGLPVLLGRPGPDNDRE